MDEFGVPGRTNPRSAEFQPAWVFANGMFGLVLSFGLLYTALKSREARSWRFGAGKEPLVFIFSNTRRFGPKPKTTACNISLSQTTDTILVIAEWLRGFIADYGVPVMVVVWTCVSYIPWKSVPQGIPRRLVSPNPWSPGAYQNWTVIKVLKSFSLLSFTINYFMLHILPNCLQEMLDVPVVYIVLALVPASMIAVLYYFDHSVASQLAQQEDFNLRKPPSFHYDLLLLGFLVKDVVSYLS